MSKGDKDRTKDYKSYRDNWDKIFKKKKEKKKNGQHKSTTLQEG